MPPIGCTQKKGRSRPVGPDRDQRRPRPRDDRLARQGGQVLDRRPREERRQRELAAELRLDPGDQADRQQRLAPEFEEVVGDADRADVQHLFPDPRESRFRLVPRGHDVASVNLVPVGRRQGLAVELAVGRQR